MKKCILFLILLIYISIGVNAQQKTEKPKFDKDQLDEFIDLLDEKGKMMGCISIMQDGEIVYEKSLGFANVETSIKNSPETKFRIGSITKVFTSTLIFQLIEKGKISLDTKVSVFFPDLPNAEKISISNLLNHSSGIFSFTNDEDFMKIYTNSHTRKELQEKIEAYEPIFEPGSKREYSNSNYILLTLIIEALRGKNYSEVVAENIIKKVRLENTYYGKKINIVNNEASSYSNYGNEWILEKESDMTIPLGAGGMVSNPTDLTMFLKALFGGKLVSPSSLGQMQDFNEEGYGRGLFKHELAEVKMIGHNGGIDGFQSRAVYVPEKKAFIAINVNGTNISLGDVFDGVVKIYLGMPCEFPNFDLKELEIPEEELKNYDGVYACPGFPMEITITNKDGQLFAQATGQGAFPLTPYEGRQFKFDPAGITMIFGEDEKKKGAVDYKKFVLKQGPGAYEFTRKE